MSSYKRLNNVLKHILPEKSPVAGEKEVRELAKKFFGQYGANEPIEKVLYTISSSLKNGLVMADQSLCIYKFPTGNFYGEYLTSKNKAESIYISKESLDEIATKIQAKIAKIHTNKELVGEKDPIPVVNKLLLAKALKDCDPAIIDLKVNFQKVLKQNPKLQRMLDHETYERELTPLDIERTQLEYSRRVEKEWEKGHLESWL